MSRFSVFPLAICALLLTLIPGAVLAQTLGTPTPYGPSGTSYDPTPTYSWSSVSGANYYRLAVKDTSGQWVYLPEPLPTSTSYTHNVDLPRGQCYTWQVRAERAIGDSGPWTSPRSFCIGSFGPPSQYGPSGNIYDTTPTYSWGSVSGANYYRLAVKDTSGNWVYLPEPLPSGTSYTHGTALPSGQCYTWQVRAEYAIGDYGPWTSTRSFCILDLGTPTPYGPSGSTTDTTPTYSWGSVAGANYYRLAVKNMGGQWMYLPEPLPGGTSYTHNVGLPTGQCYTWQVRAERAIGDYGPWTSPEQICINAPLGTPTPYSPTGNTTDTTPTFDWSTVSGANYYRLRVENSNGTPYWNPDPEPTSSHYTPPSSAALLAGECYDWKVRAERSSSDYGSWSLERTVCIDSSTPEPISPVGSFSSLSPNFQWTSVPGATYTLVVKRKSNDDIWLRKTGLTTNSYQHQGSDLLIPANIELDWYVEAEGQAGNTASFKVTRRSHLVRGMHSHLGYPRDLLDEIDAFLGTEWQSMDNAALAAHANAFDPDIVAHSGLSWIIQPGVNGWLSTLDSDPTNPSSAETLDLLTSDNIVAHPIALPEALASGDFGDDSYGFTDRRTLALIGPSCTDRDGDGQCTENDLMGTFDVNPRNHYRLRVPAMFNVQRADGLPLTDADLFPTSLGSYVDLVFSPLQSGSFEHFVRQQYKEYIRSIILASLDGTVSKIEYWLLGNEPVTGVFIHPDIYAQNMRLLSAILSEIQMEMSWASFGKNVVLGNFIAPALATTELETWLDALHAELGSNCVYQSSSLDLYLTNREDPYNSNQNTNYRRMIEGVEWFFDEVNAHCPGTEFFIKETGLSSADFDTCSNDPNRQCLADAGAHADTVPLNVDAQEEILTLLSVLHQLGFTHIAWFNHFEVSANHIDILDFDGGSQYETRLGAYLGGLDQGYGSFGGGDSAEEGGK